MEICSAAAELLHADGGIDGQTDMTKLIVAYRNFAKKRLKTHSCNCSNSKGWTRDEERILSK